MKPCQAGYYSGGRIDICEINKVGKSKEGRQVNGNILEIWS